MRKKPFDIEQAISLIREAVDPFPKAAMFELADEGFSSPVELLVACIISMSSFAPVRFTSERPNKYRPSHGSERDLIPSRMPCLLARLRPEVSDRA